MQYLLHIDTSSDAGVVAIGADGLLMAQLENKDTRNHAAVLNTMVDETLKLSGISLNELSAVVVCAGPGSYTGLRIGMATAKAFCYTLNIPLILDNKLTLLAHQGYLKNKDGYDVHIAVLKARDKEYFIAVYDNTFTVVVPPGHIKQEDFNNLIDKKWRIDLVTDTKDILNSSEVICNNVELKCKIEMPHWVDYSFKAYKCNRIVNLSEAEPFYLKQVYTHN